MMETLGQWLDREHPKTPIRQIGLDARNLGLEDAALLLESWADKIATACANGDDTDISLLRRSASEIRKLKKS